MDYISTIHVAASPEAAKRAITDQITDWWTDHVDVQGDTRTVHFGQSQKTFQLIKPKPDQILWHCTKANLIHAEVSDPHEWEGTTLEWQISAQGSGTHITLRHRGLTDALQCYGICVGGWQHFFEGSLNAFLNGQPATPSRPKR
ncbi:SRPBCC domain-containing protein [Litoreibacter sp.]|nr:SRPBCC domain-containing protein [Litoreibacter sp.]